MGYKVQDGVLNGVLHGEVHEECRMGDQFQRVSNR